MAARTMTAEQREAVDQARRELVEQLHQQLADGMATLDNRDEWQRYLAFARSFHQYSFGNQLLIMMQRPDATAVAGYRAWHAKGYQVRRGETAIRVLGPITRRVPLTDPSGRPLFDEHGTQRERREIVGVKPVSVFDIAQTVGPPAPEPPRPALLVGEAPPGLWQSLAELVAQEGFRLERGDCHGAFGLTDFGSRIVRVRADVDDAQAVKTLAHELGHVLLTDPSDVAGSFDCRGLREVEAESVAFVVTGAHGLDSSQYTFNYVTGWASRANEDLTAEQVVRATGQRVVTAVDHILTHTQPGLSPIDDALGVLEASIDIGPAPVRGWPPAADRPSPGARVERASRARSTAHSRGIGVPR